MVIGRDPVITSRAVDGTWLASGYRAWGGKFKRKPENFGSGLPARSWAAGPQRSAPTHPERVPALALYGAYPRMTWAPDYPDGVPEEGWVETLRHVGRRGDAGRRAGVAPLRSRAG